MIFMSQSATCKSMDGARSKDDMYSFISSLYPFALTHTCRPPLAYSPTVALVDRFSLRFWVLVFTNRTAEDPSVTL